MTTTLPTTTLLDSMVTQTREVADLVAADDLDRAVPTCPEWTVADLVEHIGSTQRWVERLVGEGVTDMAAVFALTTEAPPADRSALAGWLVDGATSVAAAFADADPGRPVFDPSGGNDGMAFWSRRLFGEISVHRIDAAVALERPYRIEADLAGAAISDWLQTIASPGWAANVPGFADAMRGDGATIAWVARDADRSWLLRRTDAPLELTEGDAGAAAGADVAIEGPAEELLTVVSRRRAVDDAGDCSVRGDRAELDHLIDHMVWIGA